MRIDPDGLRARGYFDQPLPADGAVEFGYGDQVVHQVSERFDATVITRLDRGRLPEKIQIADGL